MRRILCLILLAVLSVPVQAQYKAVLVMLRAERNKTQGYLKMGEPEKAAQVQEEAKKVRQVTINDFTDNFSKCPVYYFIDTNLNLVKEGKLEGVILNKDMQPYPATPLNQKNDHYLIVYYGKPPASMVDPGNNGDGDVYYTKYVPGDGLVVLGPTFEKLPASDMLFIYTARFRNKKQHKYNYASKIFNMEYQEYAHDLQKRLE